MANNQQTPNNPQAQINQQTVQNEELLDISGKLVSSLTDIRRLNKENSGEIGIQLSISRQLQRVSLDIASSVEKRSNYSLKAKDIEKQISDLSKKQANTEVLRNQYAQDLADQQLKFARQKQEAENNILATQSKIKQEYANQDDITQRIYETENKLRYAKGHHKAQIRNELLNQRQALRESINQTKNLEAQIKEQEKSKRINGDLAEAAQETLIAQEKAIQLSAREIEQLKEDLVIRKRIESSVGVTGGALKALSKIPGIGKSLNVDEAITGMEEYGRELELKGKNSSAFANRTSIAFKGLGIASKQLGKALLDPVIVFGFLLNSALKANSQVVDLGKNLGKSSEQYRENLADAARTSNNLNVTTESLVGAFNELVSSTGYISEFSADTLETQIMLTKQFGLTADEAAGIYKFSVLTGKSSKAINDAMVGAFTATRNSLKVGIPFKAAIAEAAKVSGALASSFQNNPERIAAAVVQVKALGTSLEQTSKQGEALLNFESSLENELKAELLVDKQLNLERARAAALMGDQVTLAQELAKNVGTIEEFDKMNVLQKKALAESVGLTTDELANQLRNQKIALETGKSLAQITKEQALDEQKRQDVQTKFNAAVLKLQDIFANIVAGPLGELLNMLSDALSIVNLIALPFSAIYKFTSSIGKGIGGWLNSLGTAGKILKGIASAAVIYAAYTTFAAVSTALAATVVGGLIAPIAGAAAAATVASAGFGLLNSKKGDDIISEGGYGKRTLLAPEGAIKLNDNDTIIAGTNLGVDGKSLMSPKSDNTNNTSIKETNISIPQIDLTPMINAIKEVKASVDKLYNKETVINMDGKRVGTTLTQGSYTIA